MQKNIKKVSEKEIRETYFKAFGKEFDAPERKQPALPILIAYCAALINLNRFDEFNNIEFILEN